ncbi:Sec-independent protein translocase protein TatB [Undibacter mobilis]|uniref:Sec-independent protein translocase protein TatB n=1 Tax=Undibacter mobilis TaxID=2292256 RepID=A0A371B0L5_9BRAD|nr:Sec-independent protein translocase protein TatB [Undibacter mobilis]RDV01080.1 twin-arginine translocase subunit TatB [Undibacter mobilis]
MFNFGWGEIVLIGIVALIAIGPKELPTVLRSVGQMMAKVRRMAAEFQGQFQEALREAEIADLKKQAEDLTTSVKEKVTDFTQIDPLSDTKKQIESAFDAPSATAADHQPDAAPVTPVQTAEALPPAEPSVDLARIDVPLPEPLPPPTSADFLPKDDIKTAEAAMPPADKKAGGSA